MGVPRLQLKPDRGNPVAEDGAHLSEHAPGRKLVGREEPDPGPLAFGSILLGGFLAAVTGLLVAGRVTPRAAVTSGG
jgi:hypothetical protein